MSSCDRTAVTGNIIWCCSPNLTLNCSAYDEKRRDPAFNWAIGQPHSSFTNHSYIIHTFSSSRSRWPQGLRRGSSATRLLGLRVRIPPGHECLFPVIVGSCQIEVSAKDWSLVLPSACVCASLSVIKCKNDPLHLRRVGRRGQTKKERMKDL